MRIVQPMSVVVLLYISQSISTELLFGLLNSWNQHLRHSDSSLGHFHSTLVAPKYSNQYFETQSPILPATQNYHQKYTATWIPKEYQEDTQRP